MPVSIGKTTNDEASAAPAQFVSAKLTVADWRARYLFGLPTVDNNGNEIEDSALEWHLDLGYELLSTFLDLPILREEILDEPHDYHVEEYKSYAFIQLYRYPVIEITDIRAEFPVSQELLKFPLEWVRLDKAGGQINLIPSSGSISAFFITQQGAFLPLFQRFRYLPAFWRIAYNAGFEDDKIPIDVADAAAKLASISVLRVLGDLIGGVGVQSLSVSLDGLSQSVPLTKTATTGAFEGRISGYKQDLFPVDEPPGQLFFLKRKYKGIKLWSL